MVFLNVQTREELDLAAEANQVIIKATASDYHQFFSLKPSLFNDASLSPVALVMVIHLWIGIQLIPTNAAGSYVVTLTVRAEQGIK